MDSIIKRFAEACHDNLVHFPFVSEAHGTVDELAEIWDSEESMRARIQWEQPSPKNWVMKYNGRTVHILCLGGTWFSAFVVHDLGFPRITPTSDLTEAKSRAETRFVEWLKQVYAL